MSAYALHRSGAAADGTDHAAVTPEIDLSKSVSASGNKIVVVLRRTAGEGDATVTLYHRPADNPVYTGTAAVTDAVEVADQERVIFTDLLAGHYKILVNGATDGVFDVIESHSEEFTSWNNE